MHVVLAPVRARVTASTPVAAKGTSRSARVVAVAKRTAAIGPARRVVRLSASVSRSGDDAKVVVEAKEAVNELTAAEGNPEKFLVLYSPQYHSEAAAEGAARRPGPVVVAENEVKIVTLADEVADSAWLALPGLFWVYLCFRFYEYGVATGRM